MLQQQEIAQHLANGDIIARFRAALDETVVFTLGLPVTPKGTQ